MRASHASAAYLRDGPAIPQAVKKEKFEKGLMVKGRNEPVTLPRVAHVVARVKNIPIEELCEAYVLQWIVSLSKRLLTPLRVWSNSVRMFNLGEV